MEWTHYYDLDKTPYVMKGVDTRRALEAPWEALANGAGSSRPVYNKETNNQAQQELRRPAEKDLRIKE